MPALKAFLSRLRRSDGDAALPAILDRRHFPERRAEDRRNNVFSIRDRETRLRLAVKAVGFGTYHLDCLTGENEWSPQLKAIAGLPPGPELVSAECLEGLLHPADRERVLSRLQASLEPQSTGEFEDEHRFLRPDGSICWVKVSGRTTFIGEGERRLPLSSTGIVLDITERKESEEALRRSQESLDLAVRAAAIGIWNWDLGTGEIFWSERCYQLFGIPAGEPLDIKRVLEALHPEDRERISLAIDQALARHEEYCSEHRILWPDGSIHWGQSVGHGNYNEAGEAIGMNGIVIDIADRKASEEALREQQEQLRLALRAGSSGTFEWDARTFEHRWSDELLALYGLRREDFRGRHEEWLDCIEPADRHLADQAMRQALKQGEYSIDFRIRRRDNGLVRWMNARGLLSYDAQGAPVRMVGVNIDITEQKRADEVLRWQARLLDLAHEPILVWDQEQGILFWNQGCQRLYGYSAQEAMGQTCYDLLKTIFPVPWQTFWDQMEEDGQWMGEVRQITRSGREIVVHSRMQRLRMDDRMVILEANRDITESKLMQEALSLANEDLEQRIAERTAELVRANEALEQSNHELQQFAYIAAHDLQTPLRSISGFAQLLQKDYEGRLDSRADLWIDQLVEHARRMQVLIQDVLAYSRVESHGRPFQPVSLEEVFDGLLAAMDLPIRESGARISRGELPTVLGDRTQLTQVLQNLLDNGIKYRGSEAPQVRVAAVRQGGEWLLSVADNGIGIAEKHRERIFEIFRRLHTQQAYPGTGIGLSICRRVIQRHGGRIWVESEPGKGSVFYFTLPAGEEASPAGAQGEPA